jgi:hypothetical protein
MLIGLLALWRWQFLGGALTFVGALVFFWFAAGHRFVPFFAATILPARLVLMARFLEGTAVPEPPL